MTKLVKEKDLVSAAESAAAMDKVLKNGKRYPNSAALNAAYMEEIKRAKKAR